METLGGLFASGRMIDLILVLVVAEAIALTVLWMRTGRGVSPRKLLPNLASGVALMLAVRAALTGAPWTQVALFLTVSFAAHVADIAVRWRS